jgi:hypothetical protein
MSKQSRWIVTFIIILGFAAIACQALTGGDDETGEQEEATSSNVVEESFGAEQPAEDTESAQSSEDISDSVSEADDSAAEDVPEEPAEEPATAVELEPTLIPTNEPPQEDVADSADEPTEDVVENEQEPPPSDSDDSVGDSTVASGSSQTACDHPYLPLRTGATWTYNSDGETLMWEVIDVQGDLNNATAVLRISVSDVILDYSWSCSSSEGLFSYDFVNLGFSDLGVDMTLEQKSADGHFLLPADQLVPGATWVLNLESTLNYTQETGDQTIAVTGDMITVQNNEVVGAEPVEFDGQTVDGIQVQQVNGIDIVISVLGTAVEQGLTVTNNTIFGKGIGIVTQTSVTDFGPGTMELISYDIP